MSSSPNTPGLRELRTKEPLRQLMLRLQDENQRGSSPRPLLLKIAPIYRKSQLNDIVDIALEPGWPGLVATNTTHRTTTVGQPGDRMAGNQGPAASVVDLSGTFHHHFELSL